MKNSRILIALAVLAILAAVAYLVARTPHRQRLQAGLSLPVIDKGAIRKLTIDSPVEGRDITLTRNGEEWRITAPKEYEADSEMVGRLVEKLDKLAAQDVIAVNKENHELFQVGPGALVLNVYTGGDQPALSLVVGKNTPDWRSSYARLPDRDEVFTVRGTLKSEIDRDLSGWRQKKVLAGRMKKEEVTGMVIALDLQKDEEKEGKKTTVRDTRTLTFDKTDSGWTMAGLTLAEGETFYETRLDSLIQSALNFTITDFVDEPPADVDFGFGTPAAVVTLKDKAGEDASITFGATVDEGKNYWVKVSGREAVYKANKYKLTMFDKQQSYFRKPQEQDGPAPGEGGGLMDIKPEAMQQLPPEVRQAVQRKQAEEQAKQRLMQKAMEQTGN